MADVTVGDVRKNREERLEVRLLMNNGMHLVELATVGRTGIESTKKVA